MSSCCTHTHMVPNCILHMSDQSLGVLTAVACGHTRVPPHPWVNTQLHTCMPNRAASSPSDAMLALIILGTWQPLVLTECDAQLCLPVALSQAPWVSGCVLFLHLHVLQGHQCLPLLTQLLLMMLHILLERWLCVLLLWLLHHCHHIVGVCAAGQCCLLLVPQPCSPSSLAGLPMWGQLSVAVPHTPVTSSILGIYGSGI